MEYAGQELHLFSHAKNWKTYWASFISTNLNGLGIEVGAGIGSNVEYLKEKTSALCLVEPDEFFCSRYLSKFQDSETGLKVCRGTLADLPPDTLVDHIYYIDVLEHILDDSEEIRKAISYLNAGGSIFIVVPAYDFLFSDFDLSVGHYRRYNRNSIQRVIPEICEIKQFKFLDSLGILTALLSKCLGNKRVLNLRSVLIWDKYLVPLSIYLDRIFCYRIGKSIFVEITRVA